MATNGQPTMNEYVINHPSAMKVITNEDYATELVESYEMGWSMVRGP